MCGRSYSTYTAEELYFQFLNKKPLKLAAFRPNYNMSPTQTLSTVRLIEGARDIDTMAWGLIPKGSIVHYSANTQAGYEVTMETNATA